MQNQIRKYFLGNELAHSIHYTIAIASLNNIDLTQMILAKDKDASIKYNHAINVEAFLKQENVTNIEKGEAL